MTTALRYQHQVLGDYLRGATTPVGLSAPGFQPRIPVASPSASIPQGKRPIPSTTEQNKKTNVQIPYARFATKPIEEGEIVFVERGAQLTPTGAVFAKPRLSKGFVSDARVVTIEDLNNPRDGLLSEALAAPHTYDSFPYRLDGVVNNSDGYQYGHIDHGYDQGSSHTQVNVAVKGHVRLLHDAARRADRTKSRPGNVVLVGLEAIQSAAAKTWTHRLVRFSSSMLSFRNDAQSYDPTDTATKKLVCAWIVGRVVDPMQSPGFLTITVDVAPILPIATTHVEEVSKRNPNGTPRYVLRYAPGTSKVREESDEVVVRSVGEALEAKWPRLA